MTQWQLCLGAALAAMLILPAAAADSPYAGQQSRTIKALSPEEVSDYVEGRGMGTSKAAELNHYPGPLHVLAESTRLRLSDAQRRQAQSIFETMSADARREGRAIVAKEAELEALYSGGKATPDALRTVLDDLARLQSEFRYTHLSAHLALRSVLTAEQVARYDALRGYADNAGITATPSAGSSAHEHMHH